MEGVRRAVLVGAGGNAPTVLAYLDDAVAAGMAPPWDVVGVVDDAGPGHLDRFDFHPVPHLGGVDAVAGLDVDGYLLGTGLPAASRALVDRLPRWLSPISVVHPRAFVAADVQLGPGCLIFPQSAVSELTVLGAHCLVTIAAVVGHHCTIGDFVSILPRAFVAGGVTVGDGVQIGAAASVVQGLTIGAGATVAAGAVVTRDVEPGVTVAGVPARPVNGSRR